MSDPRRFRFPARRRLRRNQDFDRVRTEGKTIRGKLLMLGVLKLEEEPAFKIGFVTSKRIGKAVVRNRVRRRLREILRHDQHRLVRGFWLVVIARPPSAEAAFSALEKEWRWLTDRAGISY